MECKKALTEADGDAAKAEEILRVKLGNKASKAAARVTAEGVVTVYVSEDRKVGAILEVNSETDFVAKNEEFQKMAQDAVRLVAEQNPADIAALSALNIDGKTLEEVRTALVGKIGENMTFRRFQRFEAQASCTSMCTAAPRSLPLLTLLAATMKLLTTSPCTSRLPSRRLLTSPASPQN